MVTTLHVTPDAAQAAQWPASGKHIMAQYDETTVTVYQAYRPKIAAFAVKHQYFGGEFKFGRMTWINRTSYG